MQITTVHKVRLTFYESMWLSSGHRKVSLVDIKWANVGENIWQDKQDSRDNKTNTTVLNKLVSVKHGSTVWAVSNIIYAKHRSWIK